MSDTVIQVDNVSKLYQLGEISTGTLSRDLHRWWTQLRGKEDPFQKIGQTNDRTVKSAADFVWALKDISFEVKQGEVLGIIGRNGAGKSTLLKILSRVTKPTSGRIRVKGRIASLLEVGTGFHPELTGRENIFLNGAIMGMTKTEIKSKLDEIIAFAGVERYIDTPVKRYSSGMYVRLAFAVAAHLDPEILVIDEVLAVGDAEFQKKCLGKMKDVSEKEGRTVLFVSHNMGAVRSLCNKVIILKNGGMSFSGLSGDVVNEYLRSFSTSSISHSWNDLNRPIYKGLALQSFFIEISNKNSVQSISTDSSFIINIKYNITEDQVRLGFTISFWNDADEIVFQTISNHEPNFYGKPMKKGKYITQCNVPGKMLNQGNYSISLNVFGQGFQNPVVFKNLLKISIADGNLVRGDYFGGFLGYFRPQLKWESKQI